MCQYLETVKELEEEKSIRIEEQVRGIFTKKLVSTSIGNSVQELFSIPENIFGMMSKKLKIEIFTKILEYEISKCLNKTKLGKGAIPSGNNNNLPDIFLPKLNLPVEIKGATGNMLKDNSFGTSNSWTSGGLTKRDGFYLLILVSPDFSLFYVCLIKLSKCDWRVFDGYYGPMLNLSYAGKLNNRFDILGKIDGVLKKNKRNRVNITGKKYDKKCNTWN